MPRLLLVDDNPSIHRIAESLLAPTDVELVCVDSAAEALDRLGRGERFDVALVDTAMPGMDGWTLLGRLRAMEATARMPIALMAGVLDPVDPAKLAKAPIQGFLKKPIELRELGDRVKVLLATPVPAGPSPFSTVPATPAAELVKRAETPLPEFRSEPVPAPEEEPADPGGTDLNFILSALDPDPEADLLLLSAEDLWPEEVAPVPPELPAATALNADVQLELEELDLESLQGLSLEPAPEPSPEVPPAAPEVILPSELSMPTDLDMGPDLPSFDLPPVPLDEENLVTLSGLEELGTPLAEPAPMPEPAVEGAPEPAAPGHGALPTAAVLVGAAAAAGFAAHGFSAEPPPAPVAAAAAGGQTPAVSGQVPVASDQAQALIQALLADPILVDALVKAVVARMGDQVLREIAWEVMPDLAGRLQR